jgi:hypothetical protein
MKTHPKIHNESKTKHWVYSRYNKQVSKAIVALTFSLLWESTHAVLPEDTTWGGDFVTENIQFCNYSRVIIWKTEWILTASHCINKKTKKDLVYFHWNALLNPEITKRFHQLPSLKISEISENNLIWEKVYIPWHLEDKDWNKQYFTLAWNALKDIQNWFFFIKMKEDELINANKRLNKTQPIWKWLSGSPVILSHNDTIVWIVSEATKDGKYIYFSGPENLKLLRSLIESK